MRGGEGEGCCELHELLSRAQLTLRAVGSLPRGVARAAIVGAALAVAGALVGAARRGGRDEGGEEQELKRHGYGWLGQRHFEN